MKTVTLEELVNDAALLTRYDRKYLLSRSTAEEIIGALDAETRVLDIDGLRNFAYDSVYFDTPDHLVHRRAAHKRRRRFKVRTRSYLDTGTSFFEVKTKNGRGQTVKQRISHDPEDRMLITDEAQTFVTGILAGQRVDREVVEKLRPSLVSRYRRMTLLLPSGSRATIDTELSWQDPSGREVHMDEYVIVETKSAGRTSELDRSLWRAGIRPTGISKFGTGTAALRPELPRNTWTRALNGPFNE